MYDNNSKKFDIFQTIQTTLNRLEKGMDEIKNISNMQAKHEVKINNIEQDLNELKDVKESLSKQNERINTISTNVQEIKTKIEKSFFYFLGFIFSVMANMLSFLFNFFKN